MESDVKCGARCKNPAAVWVAGVLCLAAVWGRAAIIFVSPSGGHQLPFETWVHAATNLVAAVATAGDGDTVRVTNGVYRLEAEITITNAVRVESVHGPDVTIIDAQARDYRCLTLGHTNAIVAGFEITGGRGYDGGGVSAPAGGTISNCLIRTNVGDHDGGGVFLGSGALLVASMVISNTGFWGGGVVCRDNGRVSRCVLGGNWGTDGGGVRCDHGGIIENSLIVTNKAAEFGGGIACRSGGLVVNCTITRNWSGQTELGGVYNHLGGTYRNSILYGNRRKNVHNVGEGARFTFCCTVPPLPGQGNIDEDPVFRDPDAGDFRLDAGSPCLDAGTNDGAVGVWDLGGNPRIANGMVDMGAYEGTP